MLIQFEVSEEQEKFIEQEKSKLGIKTTSSYIRYLLVREMDRAKKES